LVDQLTMSRGLLEDFKRFAVQSDRERIVNAIDEIISKRIENTLGSGRPYAKTLYIDEIIDIVNNVEKNV
jgi:hypothetical protein